MTNPEEQPIRRDMVEITESLPAGTVITPKGMIAIHKQFMQQGRKRVTEAHALHILAEFNPKPIDPDA